MLLYYSARHIMATTVLSGLVKLVQQIGDLIIGGIKGGELTVKKQTVKHCNVDTYPQGSSTRMSTT